MTRKDDDRLLEHNYDDIQEYDNPLPRWWVYIFWATIVFSLLYALNLPGIGIGKGRIANYEAEMERARARYGDRLMAGPNLSEPQLLALVADASRVAEGKATYDGNCMPCHRADGGGMIGPNLTDDYWIHGGKPLEVLKTVNEGVPPKGMPAWGAVMKPNQVAAVVAYVLSLHGTHPANAKGPEGVRADSADAGGTVSIGTPAGAMDIASGGTSAGPTAR
jgi:cytochrome c oxidase cbb3-type subunit 3